MEKRVLYKGCVIEARPEHLRSGQWSTALEIDRDTRGAVTVKPYRAGNLWPTEKEAIMASIELGRRIIDGEAGDLTPP